MTKKRRVTVQMTDQTMAEQPTVEQPTANVKYKDTIFRMLFSEPKHLLSLYNAVSGKDYQDPDAYENPTDEPNLELKVTMLNINDEHNEEPCGGGKGEHF